MLETGERGYVKNMGLRSTRFMTRDDIEITIPNSVLLQLKSSTKAEVLELKILSAFALVAGFL